MLTEYVAPVSDQKSNASQENETKVVIESPRTKNNPVEELPLQLDKNQKYKDEVEW